MKRGDLLVIGYGNELRSDDGVGPSVAERIAAWKRPGVRAIACHQLTPELVIPIAAAGCVVFVDAAQNGVRVTMREISAGSSGQAMTHAANPQTLLQLAGGLYGRRPQAFWLTIPVEDFEFGRTFSATARRGVRSALTRIRAIANSDFSDSR